MQRNHPNIIEVRKLKLRRGRVAYAVRYTGRITKDVHHQVEQDVVVTHKKDGTPRQRPIHKRETVTFTEVVPASGEISRLVFRRKTLRKLGVHNIPR
jgi:hypothetical protein